MFVHRHFARKGWCFDRLLGAMSLINIIDDLRERHMSDFTIWVWKTIRNKIERSYRRSDSVSMAELAMWLSRCNRNSLNSSSSQ